MTYTNHGHHIPGSPEDSLPFGMKTARCGGPGLCALCSKESTEWTIKDLHDQAEMKEKAEIEAQHILALHASIFQPKNKDVIAIQFNGGGSQGRDIEAWVRSKGGNATWRESSKPYVPEGDEPGHDGWPETLTLHSYIGWTEALPGWWIVLEDSGLFSLYPDDEFNHKYEPKK